MFNSFGTLRHLPFFEELAGMDDSTPAWHEVTAGLVVLRLVDAWLRGEAVTGDGWSMSAARSAVDDASPGAVRNVLVSILDSIQDHRTPDAQFVAPRLLAYGRALEFRSSWRLAAAVYRTVLDHSGLDAESSIAAHLRLGFCERILDDAEASDIAYASAETLATATGNRSGVLRAQLGIAKNALARRDYARGERLLDDVIATAGGEGLVGIQSMALHDRAHAASSQGDDTLAIQLAHRALESPETERERDRILNDIASFMVQLGVRSAARDAYAVLVATAQEEYMRWSAAMGLMSLAAEDGMQPAFERYKRELEGAPLPGHMATAFRVAVGEGYAHLGSLDEAERWLDRALVSAEISGFEPLRAQAEAGLQQVRAGIRARARRGDTDPESGVSDVADALREMREALVS